MSRGDISPLGRDPTKTVHTPPLPARCPAGLASMRTAVAGRMTLLLGAVALLCACALPPLDQRTVSTALPAAAAANTRLGEAIAPRLAENGDDSGIHALGNPHDAFAARMLLASAADRTLDVQYYIWHRDVTGILLLDALREAASRGVRVRLLLDDNGTSGLDAELAAMTAHPNVQVRLFNPFSLRRAKWLGYITDFGRANRRMHNKSFTADNRATVIGGRNVGDEYFGATTGVLKQDLDVLAIGPVVQRVSDDFDRYWGSASAYPLAGLVAPVDADEAARILRVARADGSASKRDSYLDAVRNTSFVRDLLTGELPLEWASTTMVSDDPAKGLGASDDSRLLIQALAEILRRPQRSLVLVSPYFVPTKAGTEAFVRLAERGVEVSILTNSLKATDVLPVHAGYAKHRKALLRAGVRLYELRQLSAETPRNKSAGPFGSSSSSLHAKTFAVDRKRVFVGSFNFDPRSTHLNTELGFVIESPALARELQDEFAQRAPVTAYEVRLDTRGELYWIGRHNGAQLRYDSEPGATLGKRITLGILSRLPIDWLL